MDTICKNNVIDVGICSVNALLLCIIFMRMICTTSNSDPPPPRKKKPLENKRLRVKWKNGTINENLKV